MTDRYAVIGHPVAHSKSPQIHAAFARQTGQDMTYEAVLAPLDGFAATVAAWQAGGGCGANVTVPFKHEAYALAQQHSLRAGRARAVNTLTFGREGPTGLITGDNTDGAGLVRDLTVNLQQPLRDRRVLLLGAGGAAWGVLGPLLDESPQQVVVMNRTPGRAAVLVEHFAAAGGPAPLRAATVAALAGQAFDVVINATSAGLADAMPALPEGLFAPGALAYDMLYGRTTPFLRFAAAQAARTSDGLGMLVEQAAEAFRVWRGVRPDTAAVIAALRG